MWKSFWVTRIGRNSIAILRINSQTDYFMKDILRINSQTDFFMKDILSNNSQDYFMKDILRINSELLYGHFE